MQQAARRTVILLFVASLLALPWAASAAGPQASPRPARVLLPGALDLFSQLWSFLRKAGCHIDPNGLCAEKNGCEFDPSGRCLLQGSGLATGDNGCDVDPNGHCLPRRSSPLAGDNGCGLDPSGARCPATLKNGCELDPDGRCVH